MESILKEKMCPECNYTFKVMDTQNWVCTNCYAHEIPKYTFGESTRKGHSNKVLNLLLSKDKALIQELINDARWNGDIKTESEKEFVKRLCKPLSKKGLNYEVNKACETGIIDIFINDDPPSIIEVKGHMDTHNLMSALGQLLFYSASYPEANLFVALPKRLDVQKRKIFKLYEINQWGHFRGGASKHMRDLIVDGK
jgi:hypothetical protein